MSWLQPLEVCSISPVQTRLEVMYSKRTVFDLILPRIMADDKVSAEELAHLGEGGLCLGCKVCTYPNCGFGKGW